MVALLVSMVLLTLSSVAWTGAKYTASGAWSLGGLIPKQLCVVWVFLCAWGVLG